MKFATLAVSFALAACASTTVGPFNQHVSALMGQPIQAAFDDLGYPDRHDQIAGNTVYYWGDSRSDCSFKIVADPQGIARTWDGIGSAAGCSPYLHRAR